MYRYHIFFIHLLTDIWRTVWRFLALKIDLACRLPSRFSRVQLCATPSLGFSRQEHCHFLLQCRKVKVKSLSRIQLFATPWTAAHQAPPSIGFSRQELLEWVAVAFSQHIWGLVIPQTSRNYLHLLISESDLHLLGIATDEWLRLWSSPSRPDEHTYKCKRYRKQKHINEVPQTENIFWKQWDKDHIASKDL